MTREVRRDAAPTRQAVTRRRFMRGCAALAVGGAAVSPAACGPRGAEADYAAVAAELRAIVDLADAPRERVYTELVRYATLAANSHNSQPWAWPSIPTIEVLRA